MHRVVMRVGQFSNAIEPARANSSARLRTGMVTRLTASWDMAETAVNTWTCSTATAVNHWTTALSALGVANFLRSSR